MAKYDYRGSIHCHSTYSDGTGDYAEIAKAANEVGLDFVITTEKDQTKAVDDGQEKYHESVLMICGTEVAPPTNHYLAFGEGKLKGASTLKSKTPQQVIDAVKKEGWIGFLAHPDRQECPRLEVAASAWDAWDADGYTGMGIWDLMTDWLAAAGKDEARIEVYNDFEGWLTGPRMETIKRWDELNMKRKVVGIGEADNHRWRKEFAGQTVDIFPYEVAFRTVTNHVLLDRPLDKDFKKAKKQILDAIRHGSLYVSFDFWDDPTEFSYEIDNGETVAGMGDEIVLGAEKTELVASFPEDGLLNVYLNGQSIHEEEGNEILLEIDQPGVYRVEAMRNDMVWILSNPIYVKARS